MKWKICTAVLAPLWQTFISSFKIYHLSSIQGSEDFDSLDYDSDGSERSLESFEIQVISLFGNTFFSTLIPQSPCSLFLTFSLFFEVI
jgi:hypothetical protein